MLRGLKGSEPGKGGFLIQFLIKILSLSVAGFDSRFVYRRSFSVLAVMSGCEWPLSAVTATLSAGSLHNFMAIGA